MPFRKFFINLIGSNSTTEQVEKLTATSDEKPSDTEDQAPDGSAEQKITLAKAEEQPDITSVKFYEDLLKSLNEFAKGQDDNLSSSKYEFGSLIKPKKPSADEEVEEKRKKSCPR